MYRKIIDGVLPLQVSFYSDFVREQSAVPGLGTPTFLQSRGSWFIPKLGFPE